MHIRKMSQKYVAELLGVTPRSIRDWHAEGFPRNEDGSYSGPEAVAWLLERRSPGDDGFDDQRQRLAAAQAERIERENAIRRGEVADVREVEKFWADCIANARATLLRLPDDVGRTVPPELRAVVVAAARKSVNGALNELADYQPSEPVAK